MDDSVFKYVGQLYLSSREKVESLLAEIAKLTAERDSLLKQLYETNKQEH
jgi:hypothetical protein